MPDAGPRELKELIRRTEQLRSAVLALVVSHGAISPDDNSSYQARREWIEAECHGLGIEHPFEWENARELLAWGRQIGGYNARRKRVCDLLDPFIETLSRLRDQGRIEAWEDPPDEWSELEQRMAELRVELDESVSLDDFQDVGRRAREIVNEVISQLFTNDLVRDRAEGATFTPKERLEIILRHYMPGKSHERFRTAMNSALSLAHHVTHSSSTSRVEAFAAAQATVLIVRTLAEMHRLGPTSVAE